MIASRVAWYAAVATAIVWTLKSLAIWEAGGLGRTNLEDLGWIVGTLMFLVAWVSLGVAFAAGRAFWWRAIGGVGGAFLGIALFLALDGAADMLPSSAGWVRDEVGLWAAALMTLAVSWWERRRPASSSSTVLAAG